MTSTDIHALSGAYALDAVDDLERAAFERHLRDCATCAQEVRELRATVLRLADADAVAPPAGLRSSVLAAVSRTPQARPGRAERNPAAAATRWRRFAAVAVAASVVAVGIGFGTWSIAAQRVERAQAVAAAERARAAEIEQVLAAPDVRVLVAPVSGGTVNVAVAPSRNVAVAVLAGLPSEAGRVYQLWLIRDQTATLLKKLAPGQTGDTQLIRGIRPLDQFGVSSEVAPGSPVPTRVITAVPLL